MPRYIARAPRAFYLEDEWSDDPVIPAISVHNHEAVFTGLLDAKGEEIWRQPNPMGFGHNNDW